MALRRRPEGVDDGEVFLTGVYARLLGRRPDPAGRAEFLGQLARGAAPADIVVQIAMSDEFAQRTLLRHSPRRRRADRYRLAIDLEATNAHWVFDVSADQDFDWLESTLLDDGYFDRHRTRSRRSGETVFADLVEQFGPTRPLELSRFESDDAIDLGEEHDLLFGLGIFELLNPNRLSRYLETLRTRVVGGGWLVCVIPAFGDDPVFGEAFPLHLREWHDDVAANRPFRAVPTDDDGYPMNGQLIWAHTSWWVAQFDRAGFVRRPDVEGPLQERYRTYFSSEPARRACYVFCAGDPALHAGPVISRMATGG